MLLLNESTIIVFYFSFVYFLFDHLVEGSYRLCYADTDSIAIATTLTTRSSVKPTRFEEMQSIFLPMVKPDKLSSWKSQWKAWFVLDDSVEELRYPGKLKRILNFVYQ